MYKELSTEAIYLISPNLTNRVSTKMEFYQNFYKIKKPITVKIVAKSLSYPIKGFETANFIQMLYAATNLLKVLTKKFYVILEYYAI